MKRIFSIILILCLLLTTTPFATISANAVSESYKEGNYIYTIENGEVTVSIDSTDYNFANNISGYVTIPDTFMGYPVTRILGMPDCVNITGIKIPSSVIDIGIFDGCTSLENINIPNGVESISDYAFRNCTSLKNISIPNNVEYIGIEAFKNCSSLTGVIIPDSVKNIGQSAFANCTSLISIKMSKGIEGIDSFAFENCKNLTSIDIPDSISGIGTYAFWNCESLKSANTGTASIIGEGAFKGCSSLTDVTLSYSLQTVALDAFYGCVRLDNVYYRGTENSETFVSRQGNEELLSATWYYESCIMKSYHDFDNACDWLCDKCYYYREAPEHTYDDIYDKYCNACNELREKPSGITGDCIWTLNGTELTISGNGKMGDYDNNYLTEIPWGSGITSVIIEDGVTSIGSYAFRNCYNLISITIPKSVTSIGECAFLRNDNSFGIYVDDNNKNYSDINGVLFDKEQKNLIYYPPGKIKTSYKIPDSVTSIGRYAFYGCMSLKNITIGNSVTSIGEHAFDSCAKLTSIIIPSSLKTVGRQAFWCCYSLTDVWYKGSAGNRSSISINANNGPLTNAMWHYNTCVNEHTYSYNCDANCNNCDWTRIPNGHVYNNDCDIDCNDCGETREAPHTYDNACDSICNACQAEREVAPHVYDNACDESCNECNDMRVAPHTYDNACDSICNECEYEREVAPHVYDNICDESCNECGEMREVPHIYDNACDSICNECEYVRKVGAHIYDNNCDTICNICKAERVITHKYDDIYDKYCNICNELRENPTGITGDCTWTLDGTNLIISGNGGMGDFTDSDTNNKPWGRGITSVVFEEGVTHIGTYAFDNCYYLTNIIISNTVTSIGYSAFSSTAYYMNNANWENDVLYIGNHLIEAKTSISGSYIIKTGTKTIADYAFSYCYSLNQITIPNSVTSIGEWAFNGCSSLTSITIPDSVTSIGDNVFRCNSLISIDVDVNNTEYALQDGVLFNKNKTLLICYPAGKTEESYIVPDSVISIGESAFYKCTSLTSVIIPDSVTSIGYNAFYDCNSLECIILPFVGNTINGASNTHFGYIFGASRSGSNNNYVPKSLKKVTITKAIKIDKYAFEYCSSLTSVTIPNSVTSIGGDAFLGCSSLTSITIPDSVTSIGGYAFYECSSLTSATIGNSVTSIGNMAFYRCSSLTSFTIPDSVTSIGDYAFKNCISLTSATIGNSVTSIDVGTFEGCSSLTSITIPNSVTRIGGYAFYGCSRLESITLPFVGSSRTASGTYDAVFGYIFGYTSSGSTGTTLQRYSSSSYYDYYYYYIPTSLKSVTITDTTQIPYGAFYSCSKLTSITILDSVTSIGYGAFKDCSRLTSVTIPNSVTSIGISAFYCCSSLTDVYYLGAEEQWKSIAIGDHNDQLNNATIHYVTDASCFEYTISNGEVTITKYIGSDTAVVIPSTIEGYPVTSIGDRAFYGCNSLTSVTIPNSVTSIGDRAFFGCSSLTSVTIGNSVTSIGDSAFYSCSSLTSVTIPNSVTSIGNSAFYGCRSLNEILVESENPEYSSADGVLFNKNKTELLCCPARKSGNYDIPNSVTSIGDRAFGYCSNLTSVTIPNSVTSIGDMAFENCSSLTYVYYSGTEAQWNSIAIGYDNDPLNNATINYVDFVYGDVNGDGRINNKDLGLLMQKLNGWSVEISDAVADVNADGKVNNKDYGLLMQYVNGWDVEIG